MSHREGLSVALMCLLASYLLVPGLADDVVAQGVGETSSARSPEVEAVGGTTLEDANQREGEQQSDDKQSDSQSSEEADDESEKKKEKFDASGHFARAAAAARRGSYDYAINLYKEVLRKAPEEYPKAHYNLGSLYKAKKKLAKSLLHYQAYIHQGTDAGTLQKARRGADQAVAMGWNKRIARLTIDIEPEKNARIYVNGFLFAKNTAVKDIRVHSGSYEIWGTAQHHLKTDTQTVELEMQGSGEVVLRPKKKIFSGKMMVKVDQDDAQIRIKPRKLNAERAEQEPVTLTSPMSEPTELVTGEYLLEVTKDDYHRWVRYVDVERDETSTVEVEMSRKLPEEIR